MKIKDYIWSLVLSAFTATNINAKDSVEQNRSEGGNNDVKIIEHSKKPTLILKSNVLDKSGHLQFTRHYSHRSHSSHRSHNSHSSHYSSRNRYDYSGSSGADTYVAPTTKKVKTTYQKAVIATPTPDSTKGYKKSDFAVELEIFADDVYLMDEPKTNAKALLLLREGEKVLVLGENNKWWKVIKTGENNKKIIGWILKDEEEDTSEE